MMPMLRSVKQHARFAVGHTFPFHRDAVLQGAVEHLLAAAGARAFVETGTYLGDSAAWVARRRPDLPVLTVEKDPASAALARAVLRRHPRVRVEEGDSAEVLPRLIEDGQVPEPAVYWLDAHWGDPLPLVPELRAIVAHQRRAVVLIDDFEVPGQPQFGFDAAPFPIDQRLLPRAFPPASRPRLVFPCYRPAEALRRVPAWLRLRGHAMLFLGSGDVADAFLAHPRFGSLYREHPFPSPG